MIYGILGVLLLVGVLYGTAKVEHSGKIAAQAEAKQATDANKSLAADCTAKINAYTAREQARAAADAKRATDAAKARKLAAEKAKNEQPTLASLQAIADNPQKLTPEQECTEIRRLIKDAAK